MFSKNLNKQFKNHDPLWNTNAGQLGNTLIEGQSFDYTIIASDVDGDSITYSIISDDGIGASYNSTTNKLSGTVPITNVTTPPIWVTSSGNLGTLQLFYNSAMTLLATPQGTATNVYYSIISGNIPYKISLTSDGTLGKIETTSTGNINSGIATYDSNIVAEVITELTPKPTWNTPSSTDLGTIDPESSISITQSATANYGSSILKYVIISGNLPFGLQMDISSGTISGSASATNTPGSYSFIVRVYDNKNSFQDRTYSITLSSNFKANLVMTGSGGSFYSANGYIWHSNTSLGIAYDVANDGGNNWLATLNNSTQDMKMSTNGVSWTSFTPTISVGSFTNFSLTNHKIWKIRYRNSKWMAMTSQHNGYVFYMESTDVGANWTIIGQYLNGSTSNTGIFDFEYNAGNWVAYHGRFGILHSTDGITWTLVQSAIAYAQTTKYSGSDVTGGGNVTLCKTGPLAGTFIVCVETTSATQLYTSTNGSTWTNQTSAGGFASQSYIRSAAAYRPSDGMVAIVRNQNGTPYMRITYDFSTWNYINPNTPLWGSSALTSCHGLYFYNDILGHIQTRTPNSFPYTNNVNIDSPIVKTVNYNHCYTVSWIGD